MYIYVIQTLYYEIFDGYWKDVEEFKTLIEARQKVRVLRDCAWLDGSDGTLFRIKKRKVTKCDV